MHATFWALLAIGFAGGDPDVNSAQLTLDQFPRVSVRHP
jgi:hypothetical protein